METIHHATIVIGGIGNIKMMQSIISELTKKRTMDYTLVGCFPMETGSPPFEREMFLRLSGQSNWAGLVQPLPENSDILLAAKAHEPVRIYEALKQVAKGQKKLADCYHQRHIEASIHMTTIVIGSMVVSLEKKRKWQNFLQRFAGVNNSFMALHYNEKGAYADQVAMESYLTFARVAQDLGGVCTAINPNRPKIVGDILHVARHIIQDKWPSPEGKGHLKKMKTKIGKDLYVSCRNTFLHKRATP